jgi:hypothetical protein
MTEEIRIFRHYAKAPDQVKYVVLMTYFYFLLEFRIYVIHTHTHTHRLHAYVHRLRVVSVNRVMSKKCIKIFNSNHEICNSKRA